MRVIIGDIASGSYAEGELLPRESDIADALRRQPRRGARVHSAGSRSVGW